MPWEIVVVRSPTNDKVPLGERDSVIDAVNSALPGVVLKDPGPPPAEILATLSEMMREAFMRPQLTALYHNDSVTIEFYALDLPQILYLCGNVRGNGNPIPVLRRLCVPNGWSVVSSYNQAVVDLSADTSPDWETFSGYREICFNTEIGT